MKNEGCGDWQMRCKEEGVKMCFRGFLETKKRMC